MSTGTETLIDCTTCEGTGYSVIATMHVAGEDCTECEDGKVVAATCGTCRAALDQPEVSGVHTYCDSDDCIPCCDMTGYGTKANPGFWCGCQSYVGLTAEQEARL